MTSGIYELEFKSGEIYIGKSDNIERRWEQHMNDMLKGKHTKRIQEAYNKYGLPKHKVLLECHKDHIDLVESIEISKYYHLPNCLNGNKPALPNQEDLDILCNNKQLLKYSTAQHINRLIELTIENDAAEKEANKQRKKYQKLKDSGIRIEDDVLREIQDDKYTITKLQKEAIEYKFAIQNANEEISRLKSRGFFSRLFNL
jgi:hypothetical protein